MIQDYSNSLNLSKFEGFDFVLLLCPPCLLQPVGSWAPEATAAHSWAAGRAGGAHTPGPILKGRYRVPTSLQTLAWDNFLSSIENKDTPSFLSLGHFDSSISHGSAVMAANVLLT